MTHEPDPEQDEPAVLRDGTEPDAASLVELINEAYLVEASFVTGTRTNEAEIRDKLAFGRIIVAERDDRIVGCAYLEIAPPTSYWGLFAVHPSQQGTGLGRRLVRRVEREAQRAGARETTILVVNLRRKLRAWYRRLGYTEAGERPFSQPDRLLQPCHFVLMQKRLE